MKKLWNQNKVGTLIISYYRCGTHFLHDSIKDQCPYYTETMGEICNDNSIQQLNELTNSKSYKICILNNSSPKFYLTSATDLLSKWHVINLTRKNKIQHFISHWFWFQNDPEQRQVDSGIFSHHNTDNSVYRQQSHKIKKAIPVDFVIQWLQEQLINNYVTSDVVIDYDELINYQSDHIRWTPNRYEDIGLDNIIINYEEIKNLLSNFNITNKN
jgi:hypothetical protein